MLGDSTIKQIKSKDIRKNLKTNDKVYIKSFPGATVSQMKHYVKPSMEFKPDIILLHCGTNDLRSDQTADDIANNILELGKTIKNDNNDVIIFSITARSDKHDKNGKQVNKKLKDLCVTNDLEYIDNVNIVRTLRALSLSENANFES